MTPSQKWVSETSELKSATLRPASRLALHIHQATIISRSPKQSSIARDIAHHLVRVAPTTQQRNQIPSSSNDMSEHVPQTDYETECTDAPVFGFYSRTHLNPSGARYSQPASHLNGPASETSILSSQPASQPISQPASQPANSQPLERTRSLRTSLRS